MARAAEGVEAILNGMNPPAYHDWARNIPAITREVIAAASTSGATVILPGNVYNFGPNCDGTWNEASPHRPTTRKGRIRETMEDEYRRAGVRTVVLRAGNFISPDGGDDVFRQVTLKGIAQGRVGMLGPLEVRQSWAYVPDWARAAVGLAEIRDRLATFEDVPFPGYTLTGHELRAELERLTGRRLGVARFPWWAMTLLSPVWELAREMAEMRYLYELDHALDGTKLARLLPDFRPTPLGEALARVLEVEVEPEKAVA